MLLSSVDGAPDPIPAETRRVAGLLARAKTGEILAHLHRRPYLAASEIARLEGIHVATAQRYLKELADAGLLGVRMRQGSPRPTEEFWLHDPKITIQIDLDRAPGPSSLRLADAAKRIGVRDLGPANVVYDTDPTSGTVQGLLILSDEHPRLVETRIRLSAAVGRFLSHLPYAETGARSVWDVMQNAGLTEEHLPEILGAVGRFAGPGTTAPPAPIDGVDEAPASARPLDPELRALFAEVALKADKLVAAPPRAPILEVAAMDDERPARRREVGA